MITSSEESLDGGLLVITLNEVGIFVFASSRPGPEAVALDPSVT